MTAATSTTDRADILSLLLARRAAVHDGRCEDALADLSKDIVSYDLQPPLQFFGNDARDAEGMRAWLQTWRGSVSLTMPDPTVTIDGDLAVVRGLSRMQGEKKDTGPLELWYRSTFALQRAAGTWCIFHEHHSVPMKMDGSGLADVDLKP